MIDINILIQQTFSIRILTVTVRLYFLTKIKKINIFIYKFI